MTGITYTRERKADMASPRIASERLFLNADKTEVVADGDPEARILLAAGAGDEIPPEYADLDVPARFLQDRPADDGVGDGDVREAAKPADKAVKKAANK